MKVLPNGTVQSLADCRPGQLVQSLEYNEKTTFGIACLGKSDTIKGIALLSSSPPEIVRYQDPENTWVLAYHGDLTWELNPLGAMETTPKKLYDLPGAIIVDPDGWKLNALVYTNMNVKVQLDISTGQIVDYKDRLNRSAAFGKWDLYFEAVPRQRPWDI